jgi:hypothetical protein
MSVDQGSTTTSSVETTSTYGKYKDFELLSEFTGTNQILVDYVCTYSAVVDLPIIENSDGSITRPTGWDLVDYINTTVSNLRQGNIDQHYTDPASLQLHNQRYDLFDISAATRLGIDDFQLGLIPRTTGTWVNVTQLDVVSIDTGANNTGTATTSTVQV